MTPKDVIKLAKERGAKFVDLRFIDLPGLWQHFSVPVRELTEELFADGIGFDGSSIRGFQQIHESDMLLIPDPTTATRSASSSSGTLSGSRSTSASSKSPDCLPFCAETGNGSPAPS